MTCKITWMKPRNAHVRLDETFYSWQILVFRAVWWKWARKVVTGKSAVCPYVTLRCSNAIIFWSYAHQSTANLRDDFLLVIFATFFNSAAKKAQVIWQSPQFWQQWKYLNTNLHKLLWVDPCIYFNLIFRCFIFRQWCVSIVGLLLCAITLSLSATKTNLL